MELIEKLTLFRKQSFLGNFPATHMLAAFALLVTFCFVLFSSTKQVEPKRQVQSLQTPKAAPAIIDRASEEDTVIAAPAPTALSATETQTVKIKAGDNLSLLFQRAGLNDRIMMNFLAAAENSKKLASIKPGHQLIFETEDKDQIVSLHYIIDKLNSYGFKREGDSFSYSELKREPDIHFATAKGNISSSLYNAGMNSGMDDRLIMELAEIFGWDIDFALDIRKNDSFKILFEEQFLDGEKLGNGAILSAEFINQGERFQAVRYVHENGRAEYYTPEGKNMRKAFLRAPVDFRRISSNFNPRRLHPVTKTVRPHRGIDYAASVGTPVWSSGDGKVIASGYTRANGNYVVIQHGNNVQTKYLHLHKRKVKTGQRVRQKQIIGTVGATGLVTGPHLHYEFLLNGVHRNPRTIIQKLPKAESIPEVLKLDFYNQTQPLLAALSGSDQPKLAQNDLPVLSAQN